MDDFNLDFGFAGSNPYNTKGYNDTFADKLGIPSLGSGFSRIPSYQFQLPTFGFGAGNSLNYVAPLDKPNVTVAPFKQPSITEFLDAANVADSVNNATGSAYTAFDLFPASAGGTGLFTNAGSDAGIGAMLGNPTASAYNFNLDGMGNAATKAAFAPSSGGFSMPSMGTVEAVIEGIAKIGQLIQGYNAHKLAKRQFSFTKDAYNEQMNNQVKDFNRTIEARAAQRAHMTVGSAAEKEAVKNAYISKHSLSR